MWPTFFFLSLWFVITEFFFGETPADGPREVVLLTNTLHLLFFGTVSQVNICFKCMFLVTA